MPETTKLHDLSQSLFYSLKIDVYFFLKKKHTFRNDVLHCIWKFWFNVCSKSKQEFGAESFCYLGCTLDSKEKQIICLHLFGQTMMMCLSLIHFMKK